MKYDVVDHGNGSVWKGGLAGLAGGLAASWVMNQFQTALSKASHSEGEQQRERSEQRDGGDDATMKAAEAISGTVADRPLSRKEKHTAGNAIHYAFGSGIGGVYGVLAEVAPRTAIARGLPFGAALWVAADEIAVPALGLSKSPVEYPVATHVSALASHLVYGATTDFVRRAIRAASR